MISLMQLWLPILLSAVAVFVVSSLVHMVLKWHAPDYHGFGNEDEVLAAIRKGNPSPGIYMMPFCKDMKDMATPEMQARYRTLGNEVAALNLEQLATLMREDDARWAEASRNGLIRRTS